MSRRFNSGGKPLLRTIVDRSSFDEEELAIRRNLKNDTNSNRRGREVVVNNNWSDDDESSSSLGSRDSGGVVMRNGKVRRKLRWKPPGLRSRRKNKLHHTPALDVSSNASVMSHHTKASNKSFHTFHSTETPVQSNKASAISANRTKLFHRPNYPDTFDPGTVSTIDNEGTFIRTRMQRLHRDDQEDTELRCMSMPSAKSSGSFDFNPIMEEEDGEQPLEEARPIESSQSVMVKRPPRSVPRKKSVKKLLAENESPRKSPDNSSSSVATPSTTASTKSSFSPSSPLQQDDDSVLPMLNPDDYEEGRRLDLLMGINPGHYQYHPSDTNSMAGFRPSQFQNKANVPSPRSVIPHHHSRRMLSVELVPERMMNLPLTPERPPRFPSTALISPNFSTPRRPSQISIISSCPVPAKVANLDLNGPSNLATMIHSSALLFGQDYLPDMPLVRDFSRSTPPKFYNRPIDMTTISPPSGQLVSDDNMSLPGISQDEILIVSVEGDIQPPAGTVVNHGSRAMYPTEIESVSSSFSSRSASSRRLNSSPPSCKPKKVNPRHSRTTTGPVDVDNGVFLEAEHNLRAIHAMAAEHLAHGEYVEALEVFEEILRGQLERYGPNHYRVGTALHNISIVHLKSKTYDLAIRAAKHAVRVRKEALLPDHPDVAVSLALLGVACLESRRFREALVAFREALHIRKTTLGAKNFRVARTLNNIGCTLFEMGELDSAKLAFDEALEIQRDSLRTSPSLVEPELNNSLPSNQILLSMASTLCNLASIKLRMRKVDDATLSLEEALLLQQSVLGDDHPTVLNTIESIECIEQSKGNFVLPSAQELISKWIDPTPEGPLDEKPLLKVVTDTENWSSNMYQFLRQSKSRLLSDIGDNLSSTCGSEIPNDELDVSSGADHVGGRAEI